MTNLALTPLPTKSAAALTEIVRRFGAAPPLVALAERVSVGSGQVSVSGLAGSSIVFLINALTEKVKRPILFVTADSERAFDLFQELEFLPVGKHTGHFPSWGVNTYEFHTPSAELVGRRISALDALIHGEARVIVAPLAALCEPTLPRERLRGESVRVAVGQDLDLTIFADHLATLGFRRVANVEEVGDFAQRGGIVDFFSPGDERPIRVEFLGDTVETIRAFEVSDQRSRENLPSVSFLPRREAPLDLVSLERKLAGFSFHDADFIRQQCFHDQELPGLEWLAPALGFNQETLLDHFPANGIVIAENIPYLREEYSALRDSAIARRERLERDLPSAPRVELVVRPILKIFNSPDDAPREPVIVNIAPFHGGDPDIIDFDCHEPPALNARMSALAAQIESYRVTSVAHVITADNTGQVERIRELLSDNLPGEAPPVEIGIFRGGFVSPRFGVALLTDHEIFHREYRRRRRKKFREGIALTSYTNLEAGDYVVHSDHGIGRYLRLEALTVDGRRRDCLLALYAKDDKLYIPIEEFNRISKYAGRDANPALTNLGSSHWEKLKEKARETVSALAEGLARLYAERKVRPGHAFASDGALMLQLEANFPYEETEDQLRAIADTKRDMEAPYPMDRLICGDVGFGKTEIAVRAAMKCVEDGKQAAVLAPTTILAQQHGKTFQSRMAGFPIRIDTLSRFRTKKEQEATLKALAAGEVDIIIGTHRLLGKDVVFRDLGLLVVDEEQRFGVTHKEKLRQFKANVDTLTMTATPIPRTMQMALSGARDMSLIVSSPRGRLPITTVVHEFTPEIIAEAMLREIDRGGQVFFVHNRVQTIEGVHRYLHKLLPQVSYLVAHGQMHERTLEKEMVDFIDRRAQTLLCTAIIESGLDISNVNTIIVDRADRFGMAQLYQLRGRVGRSTERAYCYLLTPAYRRMTEDARRRLKAIESHSDLGSGFALAMRDLEIRGAGNLLGARQSGFIDEIGFDMYNRLLEDAVSELKGETTRAIDTKLEFDIEMFIPESYIDFNHQKVDVYRRLAEAKKLEQVTKIEEELRDRYGRLPTPTENLTHAAFVKILSSAQGVEKVKLRNGRVELYYTPGRRFDRKEIEKMRRAVERPMEFSLGEKSAITMNLTGLSPTDQISYLRGALEKFSA